MTNTTSSTAPAALVALALQTAEDAYKKACAEFATAATGEWFDARYSVEWSMKSLLMLQFNVEALTAANQSGFRAMTAVLADALTSSSGSADSFTKAAREARADAARALVNGWRSQLDADVLLERL